MIRRVKRKIGPASLAQAEIGYQLELARGASVIASTLTNENMTAAIGESLATFVSAHGTADLQIFVQLLAQRLVERDRSDAADILSTWVPAASRRRIPPR